MAKQMSYTDPDTGAVYPTSYSVPVPTSDKTTRQTIINFKIFATKTDRDAGNVPIHTQRFVAGGADWDAYFATDVLSGVSEDPYKACYNYVDANDEFFATAVDV